MWAAYSVLSVFGLINPLRWLPIVMFEIFYKIIWLAIVAYPLWSRNQLAGTPAAEMTYAFVWVILPIVAMPWAYAFRTYIWPATKSRCWLGTCQLDRNHVLVAHDLTMSCP